MPNATFPIEIERPLLGWPDTVVKLRADSKTKFTVTAGEQVWETESATRAVDIYRHPFAYGYEHEEVWDED